MKKLVSPVKIYARVKEEMRSYFNTGAVDDLLFPIWTKDCIDKFENTYLPIKSAVLDMYYHKSKLPGDFKAVREVWVAFTYDKGPVTSPHVFYYQTDCRIEPSPSYTDSSGCTECTPGYQCMNHSETPTPVALPSLCDVPPEYIVTHKVMNQMLFRFRVTGLLKPGNFKTVGKCADGSPSLEAYAIDTFDITGDTITTSFSTGTIYLAYYGEHQLVEEDGTMENGYYLIPDNDPFEKYLYYYLRMMIYRQLFDQSTDESFNQIRAKYELAQSEVDSAYINATNYEKGKDIYGIQQSIIRSYNKHNRFRIK